jgi:hypothetical protein
MARYIAILTAFILPELPLHRALVRTRLMR